MGRKKKKKKAPKGLLSRLFDSEKPLFSVDITQQETREMFAIIAAILGIFSLLSLFGAAGSFGDMVADWLRRTFGLMAYIWPLLLGYITYDFFMPKKEDGIRVSRVLGIVLLVFGIPSTLHLVWPGNAAELVDQGLGGGWFGYVLSGSLTNAVGGVVAFLIAFGATLIGLMLLFDVSLAKLLGLKVPVDGQEEGVKIKQPGKVPVLEGFRRLGFGKRVTAPVAPVRPAPVAVQPMMAAGAGG